MDFRHALEPFRGVYPDGDSLRWTVTWIIFNRPICVSILKFIKIYLERTRSELKNALRRILSSFTKLLRNFHLFSVDFFELERIRRIFWSQKWVPWIEFVEIYLERTWSELDSALGRESFEEIHWNPALSCPTSSNSSTISTENTTSSVN